MKPALLIRLLAAAALTLLLGGCNAPMVRSDDGDQTGDLGAVKEERPGDIYAKLGQQYLQDGMPAVALQKLKRGLEVDPDNARIHGVLGALYEKLGDTPSAERHFRKAIGLAPKNPYFRNAYGSFLCQGTRYDEAQEQFAEALKNPLYETPWAANTNAGICAYRAGDTQRAEQFLRRALNSDPRIPLALLKMAQLSYDQGNHLSARAYLQRYRGVARPTPELLLLSIRVERALGDEKAAAGYQAELHERFPDAPENQLAKESKNP